MKFIFSYIFLFVVMACRGQNFTNRTFYDFSVGDTIVSEFQKYKTFKMDGPPKYTYMMVYGKKTSFTLDTIYYKMHLVEYTPKACFTCIETISSSNQEWVITNLDSLMFHYPLLPGFCQVKKDTNYIGFCGFDEYLIFAKDTGNCFELPTRSIRLIAGIGMFEVNTNINGIPSEYGFKTQPVAAHKVGYNCSIIGIVPNGINELTKATSKLKVTPNISNGEYAIEMESEGLLSVSNALGQEVFRIEVSPGKTKIDLSSLPNGIYLMKSVISNKLFTAKIIKL